MSFSNISEARAYLVKTAYPGSTMTRQGSEIAIGRLNPAYAVKLANAVETARAQGIKAGVYSAFRTPQATGSAFDKSGQSLHSYGLATDISGIGGAGSATAKAWYKIATDAGIYNPYGYKNPREFNHFQGVPDKSAPQALRGTLNRDGTPKLGADGNPVMWAAARLPAYAADGQKLPSEDIPNPAAPAQPALRYTPGRAKMSGPAVADVQRKLDAAGFDPGPSDGVFGPQTAAAVRAFEQANHLNLDKGIVGPQVREALNSASPVPVTAGIADMIQRQAPRDFSIANPNPPQRLQEGTGVVQVPDRQLDVPASRPTGGPGQVPTSVVGPDPTLAGQDSFGRPGLLGGSDGGAPGAVGYADPWQQAMQLPVDTAAVAPVDTVYGKQGLRNRGWDSVRGKDTALPAEPPYSSPSISPDPNTFGLDRRGQERRGAASGALQAARAAATPVYGPFDTKLTPQEEAQFQAWKAKNAPGDSGEDYDLRGAFKAGLSPAANGHWSDQFKKPNEPTFSDESQYSTPLHPGGHWNGDQYVPYGSQTGAMGYPGVGQPAPAPDFFDTHGPGVSIGDVLQTYANAPGNIWNWATGGSGATPASGSGPDDYLGGIGGATQSSAPSASPTMQGATIGDISGGGSDNTLRGSDGGISSDWQSFLSPPASVANVVHPAQDYTMPAAGDFNGPGVTAAGEHQPDFSSAAPDALPNDSLAGDPLGQVAAYDAAKANGLGVPKVAAAAPAVRVASPTVAPRVAAQAYGPTNSGYGTRYQAPANWGWGNSANAARSAGYTTGIASPQYAQIAASRGYSAPADAFTPGSGGAIYAYHANGDGTGTYVDSQGREHTY